MNVLPVPRIVPPGASNHVIVSDEFAFNVREALPQFEASVTEIADTGLTVASTATKLLGQIPAV